MLIFGSKLDADSENNNVFVFTAASRGYIVEFQLSLKNFVKKNFRISSFKGNLDR